MKKALLVFCSTFGIAILSFGQTPTWSEDIAPILYANCTKCHHPGGAGHTSLMTYNDAYTYASQIEQYTGNGTMPPWPPDENYKHFARERVLPQADIDKISLWVATGRQQGDITLAPAQPTYTNASALGTVDLTVRIPTYTVTSTTDVYRNFPITTTVPAGRYVTGIEVIPGTPHIVHHVLIFHDSTNVPATMDANDPGPGYTNVGGTGSVASKGLGGWTPGASPYYTPVGTGFRLEANTNIVVQIHYPAGSQGLVDSTRINFKLTSVPQREITVWPILNHLQNINSPINIAANTTPTYYEQQPINTNYTVLSTFPHMHLIGKSIKSWANKITSPYDTIRFVNVPNWDFNWQDTYIFPNAVKVPSGYKMQAVATYDNTSNNPNNPNSPPQQVLAGESTTEEMMMVFFSYLPYVNGDENLIIDRRIIAHGATTFCNGQSVELRMLEGTGYTYQWYKDGVAIANANAYSYSATQAGNYSALISLGPNSTLTDTIAVSVVASPTASASAAGSTTICTGSSVTLNAATGNGYSYQWFNSGTPINGATSSSYNASSAGSYTVQVYNGCYANSNAVAVTTVAAPSITVTPSGPTTFCSGESVTLSAPAGLTYQWSNSASTQSIAVNQSGNYKVTVTNANNCTAVSSTTVVTVNALPSATVTPSGSTTFCQGGSVTLSAPPGLTYSWNNGPATQSITTNISGTYRVTVTNANSCSAVSSNTVVTVNSNPVATVTPNGATTFCSGGSVILSAPAGLTYLWSNNASTQMITVNQNGSYTVTVTNSNNCTAVSSATTVTVNALPSAAVTPGGALTFCQGGSVTLSAPAGLSYSWSNGASTQSINVIQTGAYQVTVTNGNNCSAVSSATSVTVNSLPAVSITPNGPTAFCNGGNVVLGASVNSSYLWSNGLTTQSITASQSGVYTVTVTNANNCSNTASVSVIEYNPTDATVLSDKPTTICPGDSVILSVPSAAAQSYLWSNSATTQSITVSVTDTFTVTVTDFNSCSAVSSPVIVTVSNNAVASITPSSATTFCVGGSVTLSANSGSSYLWSTGAVTQDITVNSSGSYTVTVTMSGSCVAVANPLTVVVHANPATPIVTASGATTFCSGNSVDLSAPAGFAYQWNTGATTQSVTSAQSESLTVTVTDGNGCTAASTAIQVIVNPLPTVSLLLNVDTVCSTSSAVSLSGGSPNGGTYSGAGVAGGSFDPAAAGTGNHVITYSYTDNNGCSNNAAADVRVDICSGVEVFDELSLTISPNPSNGRFTITFSNSAMRSVAANIFDISGKLVYSNTITGIRSDIDLGNIPSGSYLLQLKSTGNAIYRKVIVQE